MRRRINFLSFTFSAFCFLLSAFCFSGCGYSTHSLLPPHLKNIYVENFKNSIELTEESTTGGIVYKTYRPRLELDVTKAVIDKFITDGNLKISSQQNADCILTGELVGFNREALRYDEADNIEQYRIVILVKMKLQDVRQNKVLWEFNQFAGSYEYYTTGSQAKSESTAVTEAIADLARRIVWQTIEVW